MKKVGVVTWFGGSNYGTSLQAYALCYILQQLGAKPYLLKKHMTWRNVVGKYLRKFRQLKNNPSLEGFSVEKQKKIAKFRRDNIRCFPQYFGFWGKLLYNKQISQFNCIISGSDQLWNPYYTEPFLLLQGFNNKKYSYASSIGVMEIPEEKKPLYRQALSSFSEITVRENLAIKVLQEFCDCKISKVVDPTFLLTRKEWEIFSSQHTLSSFNIATPYLLCYFIADNDFYWERVEYIQRQTGICRIVVIPMKPAHFRENKELIENAGLNDFVFLINHATLICTDSFHATAISINLERDFITFLRFPNFGEGSQNSRLEDLLTQYHLENRLFENDEIKYLVPIDFSYARSRLAQERKKSLSFLISIVENC
ncbi:polysaccharide pyruvyl transferase family protein [Tannerella sp. AM09-19]|nr:polysaccharide pyruvyl transferase family protein [Tannerella sp. AM09-19]